jgi:hypothetical protein
MKLIGYYQYAPRAAGQAFGGLLIFRSARNALETNSLPESLASFSYLAALAEALSRKER